MSGPAVAWGDYNNDGNTDLFIAHSDGRTNQLFRNDGNGTFVEVGALAGVEMGRWSWGSLFADLNNDGWDDLVVANGYITTSDTGDL